MATNILLTGATGFAGSHVLNKLDLDSNDEFSVIPACRSKNKLNSKFHKIALIGDLLDDKYLEKISKSADIICHCASWAELNGSSVDSTREFLMPTIKLIDYALQNGVKRFIFLSAITSNTINNNTIHSNLKLKDIWAHYDNVIKIENYLKEVSNAGMITINLRVGLFTGENYALGILPILLPRLKTHLVPWIKGGSTSLPLIDGKDIGKAFSLATKAKLQNTHYAIDIVGKDTPNVKDVLNYLHTKYNYPLPHFSVSFKIAYIFARFMRALYKILPGDPLIVPSIVLLLEETYANNNYAKEVLGYEAQIDWKDSIDIQVSQMLQEQKENMRMNK